MKMKDIGEISNPTIDLKPDKSQTKANYKDFITIQAIVQGDGGAPLCGQNVLFSLSGSYARFRELANQKIVRTTDPSGTVTVDLMSNNLDKGTVTATIVDSAGQPLPGAEPKSYPYEFIKDPDLAISVAIEKSGAKADGAEQSVVAVSLTDSGQPLVYATVHASVDKKAAFVATGEKQGQATTDSRGVARFYLVDGNNLHESVNFSAYYEQAQWLQTSTAVAFADAYNFDISTQVFSDFSIPGNSLNSVRINLLNNNQIASGFEVLCTLPPSSSATFANGKKEFTEKTGGDGYFDLQINDLKVEKVRMEASVVLQPEKMAYADLEWQRYSVELTVEPNYSIPDGIAQNKIKATLKNDGVPVPLEGLVFKIDERSKSKFVDTGTKTLYRTTPADGTVSAAIVSNSSENYPVTVALVRFPMLNASIDSAFGTYVLTVLEIQNDAYGDGKDENRVRVSLTNTNNTVPGKKLYCEMRNRHAIFASNLQYTSEVTTDQNGQAIISMVGTGSLQDVLRVRAEDDPAVFKEVVLDWRKYTIAQTNPNQKFVVGHSSIVTVEVKDNGNPVEGVNVVFPSPYNITRKTTSNGKTSATYWSSIPTTARANVYLKNVPSITAQTSIEFVNQYSYTGPTKTYVTYGYNLAFRIIDNDTSIGSVSDTIVEAYLTSTAQYVPEKNDIWFEDLVGLTTPLSKTYKTDGNGMVTIPIRWLLNQPSVYRSETLTLVVRGKQVVRYDVTNG